MALLDTISTGDVSSMNRMIGSYGFQQNLWCLDANGSNALHIAVRKGDLPMIRQLLSYPAASHINVQEDSKVGGYSALHIACASPESSDGAEIMQLLLNAGANVNLKTTSSLGESPLHICCKHGHTAWAKILLDAGAMADPRDGFGHSASWWAVQRGHGNLVKELGLPAPHRATAHDHMLLLAARLPHIPGKDDSKKKKKGKKGGKGDKKKK